MLCYVMLCYVMLCYVMLCYVMLCYVMLCYVMLCYVMLCYVMLCYVMLCYVMLCYVMLCYVNFKASSMWSLLHNPSAYSSAWTHTSSVVGSCFIYKLGMLTGQRFQAELSASFLWKFTEFRAETPPPPHAFGIPNCVTPPPPPTSSEFQSKKPPLPQNSKMPPVVWYGYFWNHPVTFSI